MVVGDDVESEMPNYMKTGGTFGKLGSRQSGANIARDDTIFDG